MKTAATLLTKVTGWGTAGVLVALLAGCSADDDQSTPELTAVPEAIESTAEPEVGETESRPVLWEAEGYDQAFDIYGDVLVALKSGEPETLQGLDVETGEVLWETPTSRAATAPSMRTSLFTLETDEGAPLLVNATPPVWDEAEQYNFHNLELLDPGTGAQVKDLGRFWVGDRFTCPIAGSVCAWLRPPGATDQAVAYRIDPGTLELELWDESEVGEFESYRAFGWGVYGVEAADGGIYLIGTESGEELWRVSAAEALGEGALPLGQAPANSTVLHDEGVVMLAGAFAPEDTGALSVDVADFTVAAIDLDSGELLWTDTGMALCPRGVFCSGELSFERVDSDAAFEAQSGEVVLTGVDPRTGEHQWATEPAALEGLWAQEGDTVYMTVDDAIYVGVDGETQVIAIDTGQMAPLGGEVALCVHRVFGNRYEWSNPFNDRVRTAVGNQYDLCNDDGPAQGEGTFTEEMIEAVEANTWQPSADRNEDPPSPRIHIVNTVNGLVAYEF